MDCYKNVNTVSNVAIFMHLLRGPSALSAAVAVRACISFIINTGKYFGMKNHIYVSDLVVASSCLIHSIHIQRLPTWVAYGVQAACDILSAVSIRYVCGINSSVADTCKV